MSSMEFAKKFKELRKDRDLSQVEVAKQLNISRSTVGKYETGDRLPDLNMFVKIADLFDVTADELLGRDR